MQPVPFSRFPVLRILVFFVLGILAAQVGWPWWIGSVAALAGVVAGVVLMAVARSPQLRYRVRMLFVLPVALISFSLGMVSVAVHCPRQIDLSSENGKTLTVRINDIHFSDFSMSMDVSVEGQSRHYGRVNISTRGCDYRLRAGDLIAIPGRLEPVGNMGNPDETDYRQLQADKGILYREHIALRELTVVGHRDDWRTVLSEVRRQLRAHVFASRLPLPVQHFLVALVMGDKSFIDAETRQAFSVVGVAHVLALSGLHMGIITMLLWWLLLPLDYMRLRSLRLAVTLVAVVAFVIFTGASPSVVRAAVMVLFTFAGWLFYRRNHPLNALFVAALFLLLISPQSLRSVGFQLSFVSVASILILVPSFAKVRNRLVAYVLAALTTSAACMLSTVALTAYYFHCVSLLSVVANLLLLPLMPVFMSLSVIYLLLCVMGIDSVPTGIAIEWCYRFFDYVTQWIASLPSGHVSNVYVTGFAVVAYFVLLGLLYWLFRGRRRAVAALCAMAVLIIMCAHSAWVDARVPRQGLVVFSAYQATPVLWFDNQSARLLIPDNDDFDVEAFCRRHAGFMTHYGINDIGIVPCDSALTAKGCVWLNNYLVVTRRFRGSADKLKDLLHGEHRQIVLSADIYEPDYARLLADCDSMGLGCRSLRRDGALMETW